MFGGGFNEKKLKVNLRLSINRLKLLEKKKTELAIKERRDIAEYIRAGKLDRARIRVEHIIREDYMVEAMEITEMYCDILMARIGLMLASKSLDESLKKPISSVIWVSSRLANNVEELMVIKKHLGAYYGKEYMHACHTNDVGTVCDRLMHKLDPSPPPKKLVEQYMIEIARSGNIDFTPDEDALRDDIGAAPAAIEESELIALYDKAIDPPYNGPKGPGPNGGGGFGGGGGGQLQAPAPFSYPPSASAPAGYPAEASGFSGPSQGPTNLPPYSPMDPNVGGASYMGPPPDMPEGAQAPPLPQKNPAGSPEKMHFVDDPGVTPQFPPDVTSTQNGPQPGQSSIQPPVPAPRSVSPGIPDLPSVPSSFNTPPATGGGGPANTGGDDMDFDDLTRRFENLKNKK
uniref:IST1 homolog n=1 Tax=Styela clava TaxID=7725 RepID=UPI00193A7497|nr:IST1 homolog [Styela clava]